MKQLYVLAKGRQWIYVLVITCSLLWTANRVQAQTLNLVNNPDAGQGMSVNNQLVIGNILYFQYQDATSKSRLAKYDGTTLTLIANPSASDQGVAGPIVAMGNAVYCQYQNAAGKNQLAKYDGTTLTLISNPSSSDPGVYGGLVVQGTNVYAVYQNAAGKYQLARYSGSSTLTLVNNPSASDPGFSNTFTPVVIGTNLYARYQTATVGELAKYDGSTLTVMTNPDAGSGIYTSGLLAVGNTLYLTYFNASNTRQLASYSGSGSSISLIANPDASPYGNYGNLVAIGNTLYFRYQNASGKYQLASYSAPFTFLINNPSASDNGFTAYPPVAIGNTLYFQYQNASNKYQLAQYDGSTLTVVSNPSASDPGFTSLPVALGSNLYFRYQVATGKNQLAKYDGTTLSFISNLSASDVGMAAYTPVVVANTLYFVYTNATSATQLAKYDGSTLSLFNNPVSTDPGIYTNPLLAGNLLCAGYQNTATKYQLATVTIPNSRYYVKAGATGGGTSWADACSLTTALTNAIYGDTIFVAGGTYQPASNTSFAMKAGVKIFGGFAGTETNLSQRSLSAGHTSLLQGNGASVITNTYVDSLAVLDGFTVTGAAGGVSNNTSSPVFRHCVFSGNNRSLGGAITDDGFSSPTIDACVFTGNTGADGAGIFASAPLVITNCVFYNNSVGNVGGAIYGGAVLKVVNCTFVNNSAPTATYGQGGAIVSYAALTVVNSLFWGNSSAAGGTDVYENYASTAPIGVSYSYTQTAITGTGNIQSSTNPFVNSSSPAGTDGIWGTADDGLSIVQTSAARNAGSNAQVPTGITTDLTGYARIAGSAVDMGAYEYHDAVLPLTLLGFTASADNKSALLNWQTANEINTAYFNIQRSIDGSSFTTVGNVNAIGSGNNTYSYTDDLSTLNPSVTVVYYRLQMVDKDGSYTYSITVSISLGTHTALFSFSPNPAKDMVRISSNDIREVRLTDNTGRVVLRQSCNGNSQVNISVAGLSHGLYMIQVIDSKQTVQTGKLVIQ